nr:hypothetical protein [Gemmatimonadota bacterium]NIR78089.1 hypothetical protein [Gemmatimonadota bacterium]NIT86659.1 hypothetical protein [Gemmatimonadota bacterium]NIU30509.1 hypothetical protein [Gemmatimonadota bacterium]NIU35351.1 hypothetical protein [Gemmatimonadota bacterium]
MAVELRAAPRLIPVVALLGCVSAPGMARAQEVVWDDPTVRIEAAEAGSEIYQGREALRVRNGKVWLDGVDLRDGAVEFDLAASGEMGFHGLAFRALDEESYEHVYLRPHLSGKPDATQYTPVFNGLGGWQIYAGPGYNEPLEIPAARWVHVRVAFRDRRAALTVDGRRVVYPRLLRPPAAGSVALTTSAAAARFANLRVHDGTPPPMPAGDAEAAEVPPGIVARWSVSAPFPEERLDPTGTLDLDAWRKMAWDTVETGERGIANLARLRRRTDDANTVFAALTLRVGEARLLPVRFGFSDRVAVYLDGRPLYRGDDGWSTRDYRFLGTIGLFDEVILPLEPGEHELWLAV